MPVLILLDNTKKFINEIKTLYESQYNIEIHTDTFQTTKSKLSNINKSVLYILLNCDIKPYRYEIYCLTKKQEVPYCVLSTKDLSGAAHDNPNIVSNTLNKDKLSTIFKFNLKCSTAHKKKIVNDNNYLSKVKCVVKEVNKKYSSSLQFVLRDCENRLYTMLSINPINVEDVERLYNGMVESLL